MGGGGIAWEVAGREAAKWAAMAFPLPHRVRLVGLRTEPWARAKRPRINRRTRTMRLPMGRPFVDSAGALSVRVAVFVVEQQPIDNTMPPW